LNDKPIDSKLAEEFLERLGRCYRQAGSLYLVGGSSLILLAAKKTTLDIDLKIDVPPTHHDEFIRCLRQIGREMAINVEPASPDEFLPLPAGYQERRRFIGRYGSLDVYHFDFYSVALGKLQRGNEKDYADVINMVRAKLIELETLEQFFADILPKLESFSLRSDPVAFRRKFELFKQRLASGDEP
jgi:hypothetical protein